jgi:uncharacterized DUF497 family protein
MAWRIAAGAQNGYSRVVRILPNPLKEAPDRRKHKLDFSRVADLLRDDHLVEAEDRSLGYEHEGRLKITGRIRLRVFVLIAEPVELDGGEFAMKPISFRHADRREARTFWTKVHP